MVRKIAFLTFCLIGFTVSSQNKKSDSSWWNELHGWEPGDPAWPTWLIISPGYFGPNALPVPDLKRGIMGDKTEMTLSFANHFHPGDPTQDVSGRIFLPFAQSKIAVEIYGVMLERFSFSEEIRNERFALIEDGRGYAVGDLYFSTLIQVSKNRRFPNTLFRFATKTASGTQLRGARFTDTPGYFFDLSFSKDYGNSATGLFRPFAMAGLYVWQTNEEKHFQNDAFLYGLGADYLIDSWTFSASWAGYSGYKKNRDNPMQLNFELRRDLQKLAFKVKYTHGLRYWEYKTLRLSLIWKMKAIE